MPLCGFLVQTDQLQEEVWMYTSGPKMAFFGQAEIYLKGLVWLATKVSQCLQTIKLKCPALQMYKNVITLGSIAIFSHHDSRRVIKLIVQNLKVYHLWSEGADSLKLTSAIFVVLVLLGQLLMQLHDKEMLFAVQIFVLIYSFISINKQVSAHVKYSHSYVAC